MTSEQRMKGYLLRPEADWQALVGEKVAALRFGTVLITVHDGQVVQVDCTDRTRFQPPRGGAQNARLPDR